MAVNIQEQHVSVMVDISIRILSECSIGIRKKGNTVRHY